MPVFGEFEVIRELAATHRSVVYLARKRQSDSPKRFVIKVFRQSTSTAPRSTPRGQFTPLGEDPQLGFLQAVKLQKQAQEAGGEGSSNIAEVEAFDDDGQGAWYASPHCPNGSLHQWITQQIGIEPNELQHVFSSVLRGLLALQRQVHRGHGNLKLENILDGGKQGTPLARTPILLTDLAVPASGVEDPRYELKDLRQLGLLILQLVCSRKINENDYDYPVETSEEWRRLGKKGKEWLDRCNRLLDPNLSLQTLDLDKLAAEVIGRRPSLAPLAGAWAKATRQMFDAAGRVASVSAQPFRWLAARWKTVLVTLAAVGLVAGGYIGWDAWRRVNRPPTLSPLTDRAGQTIAQIRVGPGESVPAYWVKVTDRKTASARIEVRGWVLTNSVLPHYDASVVQRILVESEPGDGTRRSIQIVPAQGKFGQARIALWASDGELSVTNEIGLIVWSRPVIESVTQPARLEPNQVAEVVLKVTPPDRLVVRGWSDNAAVLPNQAIEPLGGGKIGLRLQPRQAGRATLRVAVSNDFFGVTTNLVVEVRPPSRGPVITRLEMAGKDVTAGGQLVVVQGSRVPWRVTAGGDEPLSYQWLLDGNNIPGGAELVLSGVGQKHEGGYQVVVRNEIGAVTSAVVRLVVAQPPGIQEQPAAQTVMEGSEARFSVKARGTEPLAYQWFHNQTDVLAGKTEPTLVLTNVQEKEQGGYSVQVSNVAGVVSSQMARLTVVMPLTVQVDSPRLTKQEGERAEFAATASGGREPLTYQWYFVDKKSRTNRLTVETRPSLVLDRVKTTNEGWYLIAVSDADKKQASQTVELTVGVPLTVQVAPLSRPSQVGEKVEFIATAGGGREPLTYQWYFVDKKSRTNRLTLETRPSLVLDRVKTTNEGWYLITVSDADKKQASQTVELTVGVPLTVQVAPLSRPSQVGEKAEFIATANGGKEPWTYRWDFIDRNKRTNPVPGGAAATLVLNSVQKTDEGTYQVTVTDAGGRQTNAAVVLSVAVPLSVQVAPLSRTNQVGEKAEFTATASGGKEPWTYRWDFIDRNKRMNPVPEGATANLVFKSVQKTDEGTYQVTVTDRDGKQATATVVLFAQVRPPQVVVQPLDSTKTIGEEARFVVTASGTEPLHYQWQFIDTNNQTSIWPGANTPNLTLPSVEQRHAGGYQVIVTNEAGRATSAVARLTVNTKPVLAAFAEGPIRLEGGTPIELKLDIQDDQPLEQLNVTASITEGSDLFRIEVKKGPSGERTLILTGQNRRGQGKAEVQVIDPHQAKSELRTFTVEVGLKTWDGPAGLKFVWVEELRIWVGKTEVSWAQYRQVMGGGEVPNAAPNLPAVSMTMSDALDFCNRLKQGDGHTYDLPTVEEWKGYAADWYKRNNAIVGPGSAHFKAVLKGAGGPQPVSEGEVNELGLYHVRGNVKEWTKEGKAAGESFTNSYLLNNEFFIIEAAPGPNQEDIGFRVIRRDRQ